MTEKKKGLFKKLVDKVDKKMKEKAKESCCCGESSDKGESCCK